MFTASSSKKIAKLCDGNKTLKALDDEDLHSIDDEDLYSEHSLESNTEDYAYAAEETSMSFLNCEHICLYCLKPFDT